MYSGAVLCSGTVGSSCIPFSSEQCMRREGAVESVEETSLDRAEGEDTEESAYECVLESRV